jgi:hypothetical protein
VLAREAQSAMGVYLLAYAVVAFLALTHHSLWSTWLVRRRSQPASLRGACNDPTAAAQLLDVVVRHELLQNVIRSITRNGRALVVTALFGLTLLYGFSVAGYLFFQAHFDDGSCGSLMACTATAVYRG